MNLLNPARSISTWLEKIYREAVSSTGGSGVSSTKVVWLCNGMLLSYCSALASIAGIAVYLFSRAADPVYWTAVGSLWTISTGFVAATKAHQNSTRRGITNANNPPTTAGAPDEGGAS